MIASDQRVKRQALRRLRAAFEQHRLTLFVGAGVSIDSGLPSWHRLLGTLALNSPRPRYRDLRLDLVDAGVAEWFYRHSDTPLDIVARKIRASYRNDRERYLDDLRIALYNNSYVNWLGGPLKPEHRRKVLQRNETLKAILGLCRRTSPGRRGLRRIVTYNYDDLIEAMLPRGSTSPIWRPTRHAARALPVYHVHGYVPIKKLSDESSLDTIVLTEDEYNRVANDPYSWTNLVQLQSMTDSIGLVVGMSLEDRNFRRLLDATGRVARTEIYAFMKRPAPPDVSDDDIKSIRGFARRHSEWLAARDPLHTLTEPAAGITAGRVRRMLARHHQLDVKRLSAVLDDLGVQPLWYDDVDEIAPFVKKITGG